MVDASISPFYPGIADWDITGSDGHEIGLIMEPPGPIKLVIYFGLSRQNVQVSDVKR